MSVGRNVLAGVANSAWTATLTLAALPIYLKLLGIEQYALIGLYATAQSMLLLLDMGLAPTLNREVARSCASGRMHDARTLLHTLAVVYWSVAAAIACAAWALAPFISDYWLQARALEAEDLQQAVAMMGLVVACRWPMGLYQGALLGMQRLAVISAINMVMVTVGTVGSIAVISVVSPTVQAFFAWQALVAITHVVIVRWVAWRQLGRDGVVGFNLEALQRVWRFSVGMSGIAVTSVLLTQLDKVVLSRMLSLEQFGAYALAGVLAGGLYVLLTPVFNVIYPKMTTLFESRDLETLLQSYKIGSRLLASFLFPIAFGIALFSQDFLFVWTGNRTISAEAGPLVTLLILGTALNGVMHFPFALQLASGRAEIALKLNIAMTAVQVPLIVLLTSRFGAAGGAGAWLTLNVCYLVVGAWLTHRALLDGRIESWIRRDVGIPLISSAAMILVGWWIFHQHSPNFLNVALACSLILGSILVNIGLLPRTEIRRSILSLRFR